MVLATAFQARRAGRTAVWRDDFTANAGEREGLARDGTRGEKVVGAQPAVVA